MAKGQDIVIPFGKAGDPVSSVSMFARVPEGTYRLKVKTVESRQTSTDKPSVNVVFTIQNEPARGKQIGDNFVMPVAKGDSMFAVQRLHGLVVACGIKRQEKSVPLSSVIKALVGRECVSEIGDSIMPARGDYEARTVSKPMSYLSVKSAEAKRVGGKAAADEEEGDEEDEDADADDADDDDEEGDDDEEEEEEPVAKKKSKKAKAGKAKKAKDDDDDILDEEDDEDDDDDDD